METLAKPSSILALFGGAATVRTPAKLWPEITAEDLAAVKSPLETGTLYDPQGGVEVRHFEYVFAAALGVAPEQVVSTSSCTAALHLALDNVIQGEPDVEVITSALTFSGTTHPIAYTGARVVFADIDRRTFNLDPLAVQAKISSKTRAIVPVHLHGLMADMNELNLIAEDEGIPLIEDACQAHLASMYDLKAGTGGRFGCFSFSSSKNLIGGQGGAIVLERISERPELLQMRNYGEPGLLNAAGQRAYVATRLGFSYAMQEINAALISSQLTRLPKYTRTAQRNAGLLNELLAEIPEVVAPFVPEDFEHVYHKYRVLFDWERLGLSPVQDPAWLRDQLVRALRAEGVPATLWQTIPTPCYPLFNEDPSDYPSADYVLRNSFILADEQHALAVQPSELMVEWVNALKKVLLHVKELV